MHSVLCEDVQDSIPCHLCFQARAWNEGHNRGRKRWWWSETEGTYWHVWCVAPVLYCYALLLIAVASFLMWHFVVLGSYLPTKLHGIISQVSRVPAARALYLTYGILVCSRIVKNTVWRAKRRRVAQHQKMKNPRERRERTWHLRRKTKRGQRS